MRNLHKIEQPNKYSDLQTAILWAHKDDLYEEIDKLYIYTNTIKWTYNETQDTDHCISADIHLGDWIRSEKPVVSIPPGIEIIKLNEVYLPAKIILV